MAQKWFLLDFDNSLMATEHLTVPSLIKRFNELYGKEIGRELTFEEFKQHFHAQARETLCAGLSTYFGIQIDYPTLYADREWNMMQMFQATGVEMAPNLIETLETLENQGYRFAFVSNNPIQRALSAMRYATNGQGDRLARFFGTAFFEAGLVQKPKPDVYQRAMKQLSTMPQHCYAVEDSVAGVTAAVTAGIITFGFLGFTEHPKEMAPKLKEKGATACFHNWEELPFLLASNDLHKKTVRA